MIEQIFIDNFSFITTNSNLNQQKNKLFKLIIKHQSFEILKPLIKETAEKVMTLTPEAAQTGPAKRIDSSTIQTHLDFLSDTNQKKIYEILTQSIIEHGKKL